MYTMWFRWKIVDVSSAPYEGKHRDANEEIERLTEDKLERFASFFVLTTVITLILAFIGPPEIIWFALFGGSIVVLSASIFILMAMHAADYFDQRQRKKDQEERISHELKEFVATIPDEL
jgi:purine-cytosine permease-like protein